MKRKVSKSSAEPDAKRSKDDKKEGASDHAALLADLKPVQEKLMELDGQCVKEQLKVQRDYAAKMRPLYVERQKLLKQIPQFWGTLLLDLPMGEFMLPEEDQPLLNLLDELDVEDHIDDKGSYRLIFKFRPDVKDYFSPPTVTRTVTFREDGECLVDTTKMTWVEGKNPMELAIKRKEKESKTSDDEGIEMSFFEWLQKDQEGGFECPAIGEILRRDVWQNPLDLFLGELNSSDEDDLSDEEDDEEGGDEDDE